MGRTQSTGYNVLDDSLTGDDVKEETLEDTKIPYSESLSIHQAIEESRNVHKLYGVLDRNITIEANKAMIMVNPKIGDNEIVIEGELVIV